MLSSEPIRRGVRQWLAHSAAVGHFGVTGEEDRNELLITHNFVIGWFVRHVLDAPEWRWMGLNQDNCGITIVQWQSDRPPTLLQMPEVVNGLSRPVRSFPSYRGQRNFPG